MHSLQPRKTLLGDSAGTALPTLDSLTFLMPCFLHNRVLGTESVDSSQSGTAKGCMGLRGNAQKLFLAQQV
jgi:hypothetical protein